MYDPVAFVRTVALGSRIVVRRRIESGFTDAVGYILSRTETECVVETKRGQVQITFADVTAAKAVPPPPQRRAPRFPRER